jgi:hypothetical protein
MSEPNPTTAPHDDAVDWLVGRLRWERILRELHDRAEGTASVVALPALPADGDDDEQAA